MEREINTASAVRRQGLKYTLILCAAGTILNIVGARAALFFGVPLFLDCIGTMITAMLGGYIPGIAVGYLTIIINGISDPTTAYYGTLGVLIAVSASYLYRKGVFKKVPGIICGILIFTLIGGGLGSVLTWLLYGFSFGSGISAPLAHYIHDSGSVGEFMSQFTADMLIDAADKTVSVLAALLIIRLIPERVRPRFFLAGWKQSPNSAAVEGALKQKFSRSVSLRSKVLLMVGISALIVAVSATALGCILYNRSSEEDLIKEGRRTAVLAAGALDPRGFEDIASLDDRSEGYSQAETFLSRLMAGDDAIERVCICSVDDGAYRVIVSTDAPGGEGRLPGDTVPFSQAQPPELFGLYDSGHTEPVESKDRDGRHISIFEPVYDSYGRTAGCAFVDISMRQLAVRQTVFLTKVRIPVPRFLYPHGNGVHLAGGIQRDPSHKRHVAGCREFCIQR